MKLPMRVGYLVNYYPMTSLSFIRREIAAVEARGVAVQRYAIRPWPVELVDEADLAEAPKTKYLTRGGGLSLAGALLRAAVTRPGKLLSAARLMTRVARRSDRGWAYHLAWLAEGCVLRDWAERDGVDHVHAHFATNPTDVAMYARVLGGPTYSFMVHGPEDFDRATVLGFDEKVRRASFVTAISSFCRSQIYRWCDAADWPKVKEVHCGLDAEFLHAERSDPPTTPTFVCVGRLCEQKGQLLLTRAAAELKQRGREFQLVLIGDGDMRPEIEALIAEESLEDCVKLAGWATNAEVLEAVQGARAMVLPSFAEGLPVVIMEAFALHRPVISTYIAGIPELVKDCTSGGGGNGWLVPAGSVEALVGAMEAALDADPATLAAMGRDGAARVAERHDITKEAATLEGLMREVVAAKRNRWARKCAAAAATGPGRG